MIQSSWPSATALAVIVIGQVASFEASSGFPDELGWIRLPAGQYADRWLENGWLVQRAEMFINGAGVDEGESDAYRLNSIDFEDTPNWFLQWRVITDAPAVYSDVGPASVAAGGISGVLYHFVIGDGQVRFLQDVFIPYVYADIEPGVTHTYRLELRPNSYKFLIDGAPIDAGAPEGPYPTSDSGLVFRGKASGQTTTTRWDYIRFGVIPADGSGDYDSNHVIDGNDLYYFIDCLLGPDGAYAGCRWADMNADNTVNGPTSPLSRRC